jgi:anthranilate synthase component 1
MAGTSPAHALARDWVHLELPGARDLLPLAARWPRRYPALLESAAAGAHARYDLLFALPQDALTLARDGRVHDARGREYHGGFLAALDAAWHREARHRAPADALAGLPFRGGWLLFLGYELAGEIEPRLALPAAPDPELPTALALRCPAAIVVDRAAARTWLVAEAEHAALLATLRADLDAAPGFVEPPLSAPAVEEDAPQRFLDGVARVHEYLRRGDTFQVNLSREWRARYPHAPTPAALYARLRRANPAPFAGLLQWCEFAVISSSPERLLAVRGRTAQTRPIAGTRPRGAVADDAACIAELLAHAKERAEHVMLIDLERNDLGRVCAPGSIAVDELMTVESYAHVHHLVSNVRGTLRADVTPGQAIAAVFPGGTITGCPKLRCLEIIAELEGSGRGAYTGALGYLNRDGDLDLNILIRTLSLVGARARLRAGAGIVADSDAMRELEETRAKARGVLRALGA